MQRPLSIIEKMEEFLMNKIKFLYDVVMTLKKREVFNGTLSVGALKDKVKFFSLKNEFEKNTVTGQMKAKISTEVDCDGKKINNESNIEMNGEGCNGKMHHGFMKHFHAKHEHFHGEDLKSEGINGKLHKIGFVLSILNSLNVEELEDKSFILSLNLKDIPEEIKNSIHEKMKNKAINHHHEHHGFMKEFHTMIDPNVEIKVSINKDYEIEKLAANVDGKQVDDSKVEHEMSASLELNLK
jgi:hypothetical protein